MGKLIADSGSTKTLWVWLENGLKETCTTIGMNPYSTSLEGLAEVVYDMRTNLLKGRSPGQIHFYGAGCSEPDKVEMIKHAFNKNEISDQLHISHDLLAASRSLFGHKSGMACILGTGSSSVLFENGTISDKVMSLGYLIGDEGGGMDLGRRLLVAVLKKSAPEDVLSAFYQKFDLNPQEILDTIYFKPRPNRFIASFAPFVCENLQHPFCHQLATDAFLTFIELNVACYKDSTDYTVGFVGSVACNFKPLIESLLQKQGYRSGPFLTHPMEGLVEYHSD